MHSSQSYLVLIILYYISVILSFLNQDKKDAKDKGPIDDSAFEALEKDFQEVSCPLYRVILLSYIENLNLRYPLYNRSFSIPLKKNPQKWILNIYAQCFPLHHSNASINLTSITKASDKSDTF